MEVNTSFPLQNTHYLVIAMNWLFCVFVFLSAKFLLRRVSLCS